MTFIMMAWSSSGCTRSNGSSSSSRRRRRSSPGVSSALLASLLLVSLLSTPASGFGIGSGGLGVGGINIGTGGLGGLGGLGGTGTGSTTTITAGNPLSVTSLFESIALLTQGGTLTTDITSGSLGGVAGSLALLAAALKAPLVALYQISAEVVVMVALILFISYIASLLGIDDYRRRTGLAADTHDSPSSSNRGFFSNIMESEVVQDVTNRVYSAIENFDLEEFLERLDRRY